MARPIDVKYVSAKLEKAGITPRGIFEAPSGDLAIVSVASYRDAQEGVRVLRKDVNAEARKAGGHYGPAENGWVATAPTIYVPLR